MDRQPHRRRRSSSPSPSSSSSSSSSSSMSRHRHRHRTRRPSSLRRKLDVVSADHHRSSSRSRSSSNRRSHDDIATGTSRSVTYSRRATIDAATGGGRRSSHSHHTDHHRGAEQRRPRSNSNSSRSSSSRNNNRTIQTPQLRRASSPPHAPSTPAASAPPQRRQTICASSPSVTPSAPTPTTSYSSSTRSGSEYSARAANYVDQILNESQLIITSDNSTPRARGRRPSTSMACASIALPIARGEREVVGGNYHHSSSSGSGGIGSSRHNRGGEPSLSLPRGTLPARRQHSSRHSMSLLLSSNSNSNNNSISNVDRRLSSSSSLDTSDDRRNVRGASSSSTTTTTTDERPRRTPSIESRSNSLHSSMSLMSERRSADVDRRRKTSASRSSSGGGGGSGHNDHPLTRRRRSCSTERATPITRRNTTATSSSSASVELGSTRYQRSLTDLNSSFKREDAFAIHRTSADMSRLRRERSHSQEPRHNHRRRPSSDSRTSPSMSLRSSNSLDGIGTRRRISGSSTVSTSYTPKHTTSNHHRSNQPQSSSSSCSSSVPRRSRSQSQDRYDGMTRRSSRSQSQERCGGGMTRKSSRSQSPDRCGGVPQRSSRSQSRDRCARSTTTTRGSTTLPSSSSSSHSHQKQQPPPPPPPPPRRVSASTADSIASERLLRLSQKICSMKESRRSSSSDTPSYVSISTQSQTTGTASPASSCSTGVTFRNTPASAGAVPMPRPRDDPPPPPPPRFTRRASSGRDVMLSSLESSKLMSSSCPTLAIVPTNDEKSGSNRPKKAINNNRKCSQKVSRMTYTDPFGNAGLYTGEVDEKSCPHGYGQMRYDNGAYFEGSWVYGCKNDNSMGPKNTNEISTMGTTITANDGFGNSQMILATVPPAVICPTNGNDNKSNKLLNKNTCSKKVSKMAYTDPFGDAGLYTGEVDEESRPHGKGKMKYDNGIYFEGNWVYGCKDDCMGLKNNGISTMGGASTTSCVQQNSSTRERILSGFTSWRGRKNADSTGNGEKGRFVYGMEWVDPAGLGGKYTGRVDDRDVPDGKGVMRYHFGLIAEGDWIKGVLNNGAGAGVNPIMAGNPAAIAPGMSVVGGGGGAMSVVSGLGMMSIGGGGGAMMGMGSYTTTPSVAAGVYNRMVNPYSNMIAVIPQTPMVSVGNPLGLMGNQGGYFPQNQMTHPQVPSGPATDVAPQPSNTLCRQ